MFVSALKAGNAPPSLKEAAAKFITKERVQQHHLEGMSEPAILAIVAVAGPIHCEAAAEKATAAALRPTWLTNDGERWADGADCAQPLPLHSTGIQASPGAFTFCQGFWGLRCRASIYDPIH